MRRGREGLRYSTHAAPRVLLVAFGPIRLVACTPVLVYTRDGNTCVVHVDSVNVYGLEAVTGIVCRSWVGNTYCRARDVIIVQCVMCVQIDIMNTVDHSVLPLLLHVWCPTCRERK